MQIKTPHNLFPITCQIWDSEGWYYEDYCFLGSDKNIWCHTMYDSSLWELGWKSVMYENEIVQTKYWRKLKERSSASAIHTMMVVLFSGNFPVQCWRCSPSLEIVEVPRKNKGHLCPCLFTAFHRRNPHGLFSLFVILSYYWFFCVLFFPYSSFFPALGSFSHPRLLRVTDGLEKWRRRESSQPVVKERDRGEISISSKFAEVSFELCLPARSFFPSSSFTDENKKKRKLKGAKTGS